MHAYVINLARSPERRAHIIKELAKSGIDYEIVNGVDGRDLDVLDPQIVAPSVLNKSWFRPGVAGCALSHLRVYQRILADGLDWALVLEDDVTLPADLATLVDDLANHLIGAEVVLLNYDSKDPCGMSQEGSVRLPSSRLLVLPIDVGQPASAAAYVITREACRRLNESVMPVRVRSDEWGFFYREGVIDRVRCVMPLTVTKNPCFGSTIDYHSRGSVKARLLAAGAQIPLLYYAIAHRRQRIFRQWTRTELLDKPFVEKPSRLE
jgi:glycosyl transferase family 25